MWRLISVQVCGRHLPLLPAGIFFVSVNQKKTYSDLSSFSVQKLTKGEADGAHGGRGRVAIMPFFVFPFFSCVFECPMTDVITASAKSHLQVLPNLAEM